MGTRARRDREKEERRGQILDAARRAFSKEGFSGATMPGIARAAELAPGTLYLYFPGKDALYIELLVDGYDRLRERLRRAAGGNGPRRKKAAALVDAFLAFARECPQWFDVIFFLLQKEGGGPRRERFDRDQIRRVQAKEAACKEVAAAVLPGKGRVAVDAVWSMLAGVVFFWRKHPRREFGAVAGEARRIVLGALFP